MGLLTILKKMKQKEKEMRILMLYPLEMCGCQVSSSNLSLTLHLLYRHTMLINTVFELDHTLDEENMDWSPQTNYHRAHCKAFDTPDHASVVTDEEGLLYLFTL